MAKQKNFMCGLCKRSFNSLEGVKTHAADAHKERLVRIYGVVETVDNRPILEPSIADRTVEAEIAVACGERTDDNWLLA